jgi:hypothetical protein
MMYLPGHPDHMNQNAGTPGVKHHLLVELVSLSLMSGCVLCKLKSPQNHLGPSHKADYLGESFTFLPEMLVTWQSVMRDLEGFTKLCNRYISFSPLISSAP